MAVIQMPSRGKKDETGMITSWFKKTGDWVAQGDELFSFDTDDGTFTVKSQKAGRLVAIFVPEGELVHCPADVGMLASPAPDAVLKMGRMQFVDESKPLSPREAPKADIAPADPVPDEESDAEEVSAQEEAQDAAEQAAMEEELFREVDGDAQEETPLTEEPLQEEEMAQEDAAEEESDAEEAPIEAEEEPAEEAPAEAEAEPAAEQAPAVPEEEPAEEAPIEAETEPAAEAEEAPVAAEEEPIAEEAPAEEELEEEPDPIPEALEAVPQADEAEDTEAEESAPMPRPACLTAQVDMTVCMEIASRTGVSVSAMVRFAAMHTDSAALLDEVGDGTLRGMSGRDLPNVCDLGDYGITGAMCTAGGAPCFLVPAVHDAWRVDGDAMEVYPCLQLSLCFDENNISMACAAGMLAKTRAHLENLIDLLI